MTIKQTFLLKVLDDTAQDYNSSNRSIKEGTRWTCLYCGPDGKFCAAGRLFVNPWILEETNWAHTESFFDIINSINNKKLILKPEYQYGRSFLSDEFILDLQELHDEEMNWCEDGLSSPKGFAAYNKIKKDILNNEY